MNLGRVIQELISPLDNDDTLDKKSLDNALKEFESQLMQLKKRENVPDALPALRRKLKSFDKSLRIRKESIPALKQKIDRNLNDTKEIISDLLFKVNQGHVFEISLGYLEAVKRSNEISDRLKMKLDKEDSCSEEMLNMFDTLLDIRASRFAMQPNFKRVLDARVRFIANRMVPKIRRKFILETTKMGWPLSKEEHSIILTKSFTNVFLQSVKIQSRLHEHLVSIGDKNEENVLWVFQDLYLPLIKRFRFHFLRKSSRINRIDRPEWCFRYILRQIRIHQDFLCLKIKPLLRENTSVESLLSSIKERDASRALLDSYVHVLNQHLRIVFPSILSLGKESESLTKDDSQGLMSVAARPTTKHVQALLCKTVSEMLEFNRLLRSEFKYEDSQSVSVLTSNVSWLEMWLEAELSLASSQLSSLLESDTAWLMIPNQNECPTELSLGVCTLLETSFERVGLLPDMSQQNRLFNALVLPLLYSFGVAAREELESCCEEFQVLEIASWKHLGAVVSTVRSVWRRVSYLNEEPVSLLLSKYLCERRAATGSSSSKIGKVVSEISETADAMIGFGSVLKILRDVAPVAKDMFIIPSGENDNDNVLEGEEGGVALRDVEIERAQGAFAKDVRALNLLWNVALNEICETIMKRLERCARDSYFCVLDRHDTSRSTDFDQIRASFSVSSLLTLLNRVLSLIRDSMSTDIARILSLKLSRLLDDWIVNRVTERDDLFVSLNTAMQLQHDIKMLEKQFKTSCFETCKEMISLLMQSEDSALTFVTSLGSLLPPSLKNASRFPKNFLKNASLSEDPVIRQLYDVFKSKGVERLRPEQAIRVCAMRSPR